MNTDFNQMDHVTNVEDSVQKPIYEVKPKFVLMLTVMTISLSAMLGIVLIAGYGMALDIDLQAAIQQMKSDNSERIRNFVRTSMIINHLTMFVLPAILVIYYIYRKDWLHYYKLHISPNIINILLGISFILVSFPIAQYAYWVNQQIPLPSFLQSMEDNTQEAILGMLVSDHYYELIFNIIVVALIPAIGEELVFRGILQQQMQRIIQNPYTAIWVAAAMFSAFHLQFEGFFARMILGATLGYIYYWSKNLWIPIIAHFLNNGLQVLMAYLYKQQISEVDIEKFDHVPIGFAIAALMLAVLIGYQFKKYNNFL